MIMMMVALVFSTLFCQHKNITLISTRWLNSHFFQISIIHSIHMFVIPTSFIFAPLCNTSKSKMHFQCSKNIRNNRLFGAKKLFLKRRKRGRAHQAQFQYYIVQLLHHFQIRNQLLEILDSYIFIQTKMTIYMITYYEDYSGYHYQISTNMKFCTVSQKQSSWSTFCKIYKQQNQLDIFHAHFSLV